MEQPADIGQTGPTQQAAPSPVHSKPNLMLWGSLSAALFLGSLGILWKVVQPPKPVPVDPATTIRRSPGTVAPVTVSAAGDKVSGVPTSRVAEPQPHNSVNTEITPWAKVEQQRAAARVAYEKALAARREAERQAALREEARREAERQARLQQEAQARAIALAQQQQAEQQAQQQAQQQAEEQARQQQDQGGVQQTSSQDTSSEDTGGQAAPLSEPPPGVTAQPSRTSRIAPPTPVTPPETSSAPVSTQTGSPADNAAVPGSSSALPAAPPENTSTAAPPEVVPETPASDVSLPAPTSTP